MLDQHVRQGLATTVLTALVILSINTLLSIGNGDGPGITVIQAKKEAHQLSDLLDQQIAILVGPDINPSWVRKQSAADSLIYGIMKPDDTAPAGVNEDYNYPVTSNCDKEISLFFKANKRKVMIKHASHGEKLHTKTVLLSRLVEQPYRTKEQRQQVNKYVNVLWME